ncbi:MAG: endonuclease/exonuclease/phosphatase family protein [Planctomycetaceae bacterium]|nr:endonuclease/exonuclease/phosphatase family protein [Planctomycetaceae bacterium]
MTQLNTAPARTASVPRPIRKKLRYRRQPPAARYLRVLSLACLACTVLLAGLLYFVSENWWATAALTYLPRQPWLLPPLVLAVLSVAWNRRMIAVNLASALIVLLVVMEFSIPFPSGGRTAAAGTKPIRIVSCNVQSYEPAFATVLREMTRRRPDIVLLQEAGDVHPLLAEHFADWHSVHVAEYWIGSRYPLELAGQCDSRTFQRTTAVAVDVETPDGQVRVFNIHLMTARHGLTELDPSALVDGGGRNRLERHILLRDEEARTTRAFIDSTSARTPVIVAGDFNMPRLSSVFRNHWSGLTDTHRAAGTGCGNTSPVSQHRFWPDWLPWIRVDHILCSGHLAPVASGTGTSHGSDHHLVSATLVRKSAGESRTASTTSSSSGR